MKKLMILSVTASFLLLASPEIYSQAKPPAFYIDKGACPFECCVYRKWKTVKTTSAFALPNARSQSVGKFAAGSNVVAVTGEVHSVPGRFVVRKRHGKYNPGDILWTYTYLGEGIVKIWFNGTWDEEQLGDAPTPGQSCQASKYCWGENLQEAKSTWWIKIKSREGWVGWTNQGKNFCGSDECGGDCK